jgi:thiol-disulfide isomerase/thioredoxin
MSKSVLVLAAAALALLGGCSAEQGFGKAPDAKVKPLDGGDSVRISDFKGKVVLIDAWATWCGPCIETMPLIQETYNEFKDKGLVVMAITSETAPEVNRFLKKNPKYSYPIYLDLDGSFAEAFQITGIPASFVIDKQGNIVFKDHPAEHGKMRRIIASALSAE